MGYLVHRHDELCIGECRYICTLIHNRPVLSDADVVLLGFHVIVKKILRKQDTMNVFVKVWPSSKIKLYFLVVQILYFTLAYFKKFLLTVLES